MYFVFCYVSWSNVFVCLFVSARVFLRMPKIILLDEATSALDEHSQEAVQQALANLIEESNATVVLVAHRLSTVINADSICVIDKGKVLEQGNHEELVAKKGIYASMVAKQLSKQADMLDQDKKGNGNTKNSSVSNEAAVDDIDALLSNDDIGKQLREPTRICRYCITGSAAHTRLVPLLPSSWEDCSPAATNINSRNNEKERTSVRPDFVWENAPRRETKAYRDTLKAYSHLPNGTDILDSKWVLARLFHEKYHQVKLDTKQEHSSQQFDEKTDDSIHGLATLESHCFRGPLGYQAFCQLVFDTSKKEVDETKKKNSSYNPVFPDLLIRNGACPSQVPEEPSSLWVVKDAFANGAGGIFVVDANNAQELISTESNQGPLYEDHRYVAQRYAWPPVLYDGRKCHVRVYGLITSDGRAFVHKRAFLHVANDLFSYKNNSTTDATATSNSKEKGATASLSQSQGRSHFKDSVHITNCCANSHDNAKFAGEILADLEATEFAVDPGTGQTIVPLGPFFPSMKASLAALAQRSWPFVSGGQANNGFEYLGMDFILSYQKHQPADTINDNNAQVPVAYLLEVNAPPSQDTATGLKHAEDLHDEVIRDIMSLWVVPKVTEGLMAENPEGWRCAWNLSAEDDHDKEDETEPIIPSKAVIINKIRWGMFERKASRIQDVTEYDRVVSSTTSSAQNTTQGSKRCVSVDRATPPLSSPTLLLPDHLSAFARSQFPFFDTLTNTDATFPRPPCSETPHPDHEEIKRVVPQEIFFENAGGSQVPWQVIDAVSASLQRRNRSILGTAAKNDARDTLKTILGAEGYSVFLGSNATSLLASLAECYVDLGLLKRDDEIIISTENHVANATPWIEAALRVGARVKWWAPTLYERDTHTGIDSVPVQRSANLVDLLNARTRIVAICHTSNVLGQVRDLTGLKDLLDVTTGGHAHLVVDGVATAPHFYPAVANHKVDWYVVSCHKLFGPTLGGLCGNDNVAQDLCHAAGLKDASESKLFKLLEVGTINYEAAAGIKGLGCYLFDLSVFATKKSGCDFSFYYPDTNDVSVQTPCQMSNERGSANNVACTRRRSRQMLAPKNVLEAFHRIRAVEEPLTTLLRKRLCLSTKIRIIEINPNNLNCVARLPVVSFVHASIRSKDIVVICAGQGISCRHGSFLSVDMLSKDFGFDSDDGVVRLSLAHYNTVNEVETVMDLLESTPNWF